MRNLTLFACLCFALPALGAAPAQAPGPTVDFATVLSDLDGKPLPAGDADHPALQLTLGFAATRALCIAYPDEQSVAPEEKLKRGRLALRIEADPHAKLTAEEVATVKKLIAKAYGPLVVARAWPLLDPGETP